MTGDDAERIVDGATVARLARVARLPPGTDLARLRASICEAVAIFRRSSAAPADRDVRREIADLWRAADRAAPDCERIASMLETLSDQAHALLMVNADRRGLSLPNEAALRNACERDAAAVSILRICSFGGRVVDGRNRPSGRRSRSYVPELAAPPESGEGRPRAAPERELLQWLAVAYVEAADKLPPKSVSDHSGPFYNFARECFELVGARTGNLRRMIEERERARREMAARRGVDSGELPA